MVVLKEMNPFVPFWDWLPFVEVRKGTTWSIKSCRVSESANWHIELVSADSHQTFPGRNIDRIAALLRPIRAASDDSFGPRALNLETITFCRPVR